MINVSDELLEKAKQAKSYEEILSLAEQNGVEMTEEQAKTVYARSVGSGAISDDELENVAGGGCGPRDDLKWPQVGDTVLLKKSKNYCPACNAARVYIEARGNLATKQINRIYTVRCTDCGKVYEMAGPIDSFTII